MVFSWGFMSVGPLSVCRRNCKSSRHKGPHLLFLSQPEEYGGAPDEPTTG
jgi:hypothetical protein